MSRRGHLLWIDIAWAVSAGSFAALLALRSTISTAVFNGIALSFAVAFVLLAAVAEGAYVRAEKRVDHVEAVVPEFDRWGHIPT